LVTTLLENPLPTLAVGAILATLCGLIFASRRTLPTLVAFAGVLIVTLLLLAMEQVVVTDRERVESALQKLLSAIEANDIPGVVAMIDPAAAALRSDAEAMMPMVKVEDTGATAVKVALESTAEPVTATSNCRGRLRGIHQRTGQTIMYFDQVDFHWVRRDDDWLLEDFTAYFKGQPLSAVQSLRSNRVAPSTR
jgi:uncharacterized membrane protein (Fun14 family)